jgi:Fe-S oxidoreductase
MDQQELRQWEAKCIQEEPPACRAGCPLNVDARAFVLAMGKGDLDAARAVLEKSMPLAAVTARLCEAPCEGFCIRKDLGGAIAVGRLERLCIGQTRPKGRIMRLPARPKKVAVFGSGPSSLTVAFDLARKGYPISLHHLGDRPGGWLRELPGSDLPQDVLDQELERLGALHVTFVPVPALDAALAGSVEADTIFVGQDDEIAPDLTALLGAPDPETMALERPGWFTGGLKGREHRFIDAVSQGREAAVSMDRFMQNASLTSSRVALRKGQTRLYTETAGVEPMPRVEPDDPAGYSGDEAMREAGRCLNCQCLECVRRCVYLQEYEGYPKSYARRVFNNLAIVQGIRQANKFINSCSLCGQCETICPQDFSMADMCLDARRTMVKEGRMPPSAHWFALEEMRSAKSDQAALLLPAPGADGSDVLFFPGCQLSGIRPDQTLALYERLLEIEPRTGIWLDCCAAPAHWAARTGEFETLASEMREKWEKAGRPRVVTACSTCLKMFREHLPDFGAESVWSVLAAHGQPSGSGAERPLALSDPCTSRDDADTQAAVRGLLESMGQPLADLPMSGVLTECCGFGGLMENANPDLARKVVQARVEQSGADFLTYCAMCREQLARTGKPVLHILDLLFPDAAHEAAEPPAGISARRMNRRRLKSEILARCGLEGLERQPWEDVRITMQDSVADMLEERRILLDDVRQVLFKASNGGRILRHGTDGRRIAAAELGEVTFWVEYLEGEGGFEVLKAWSHRMRSAGGRI